MKPEHLPFVAFKDDDVLPDGPQIVLEMKAYESVPEELSLTLPYKILFSLRRYDNSTSKPIIFRWSPYNDLLAHASLVLLHMTEKGPERVHVDPLEFSKPAEDTVLINGWNQFVWELPPGGETKMLATLTANYHRLLEPGEKYELLWPGGEINMWDWGSKADHMGTNLRSRQMEGRELPKLILPATAVVAFTAKEESEPWPERPKTVSEADFQNANLKEEDWRREQNRRKNPPSSPPPMGISDRVAGAPILKMEIECPSQWVSDAVVDLCIKITYEGVAGDVVAKPITFHTRTFLTGDEPREGIRLYRNCDGNWVKVDSEGGSGCGFGIFDDPPVAVHVGGNGPHSDLFVSVRPGEQWNTKRRVQNGKSWTSLPDDVKVGDKFKYEIKGAVVDWWDWGTKEDHKDTVVKLPCWIAGNVVEPADNEERPRLVVPKSNEAGFSYVGSPQA